jgi:hypothetical protein
MPFFKREFTRKRYQVTKNAMEFFVPSKIMWGRFYLRHKDMISGI